MTPRKLIGVICAEHCLTLNDIRSSNAHIAVRYQLIHELLWLKLSYEQIDRLLNKSKHRIRYWANNQHRDSIRKINKARVRTNTWHSHHDVLKSERILCETGW